MFRAVRHWWVKPRHQRTVRLFFFELSVVMIGVLAAQQVSNWAQRRSEDQRTEATYNNLLAYSRTYDEIARTYEKAIPCLRQRVQAIIEQAASGKPIDPALLTRIPLVGVGPDNVGIEDYRAIGSRYSFRVSDALSTIQFNLMSAQTANGALENDWAIIQRLNPTMGRVEDADRAAARAAGFAALAEYQRLSDVTRMIEVSSRMLQLKPKPHPGMRPVRDCQELQRLGRSFEGSLE